MDRSPLAAALAGARVVADLGVDVAGDYGDPAAEYDALRTAAGLVDRSARAAVLVTGPDACSFLQSLVSQDLDPLADGEGARSLLLEPRGKLVADFRALRVGEQEWWLDAEVGAGEALAGGLRRFLIRVKAEVTDRTGEWGAVSVLGPQAAEAVSGTLGVTVPETLHAHVGFGSHRVVRAGWPEVPGVDVLGPVDGGEVWERLAATIPPVGLIAADVVRIEAGVPRLGVDVDETTIPQEAFFDRDAISFTKGCFVGQELACRIDTRGHVNRYLRGLRFRAGEPVPPRGADVRLDDASVGRVTSASAIPGRAPVGLAVVRRDVSPPAAVAIAWSGGEAAAEVVEVPAPPPPRSSL